MSISSSGHDLYLLHIGLFFSCSHFSSMMRITEQQNDIIKRFLSWLCIG
jgi:hypothetical protein